MITLSSYLVAALQASGVRHVFGVPGVHNLELYRALSGSAIRHVLGRHEQGVGFMADGYARASGRIGVCFTITGPGLTNIATAMAQAYADSVPMLVVSTETSTKDLGAGRGALHEMRDQTGIAQRVSGHAERIRVVEELPAALERIFDLLASARPRPAYLGLPHDLLAADASALATPKRASAARPSASRDAVAKAARLLDEASAPLVLAGGGAMDAGASLLALVEGLGAPLVMTANARGILRPDHPLAVSLSPSTRVVRGLIAASDVVLAVGTELGPTDFDVFGQGDISFPEQLVRIDLDEAQLVRNATPLLAIHADAEPTLRQIVAALSRDPRDGATRAAKARETFFARCPPAARAQLAFLERIRDRVPGARFVGDSTQPVYQGNIAFAASSPRTWFNSATGFGTLGYALPAAAGAAISTPDRPIVCLIGDGGIQFSLGELAVPAEIDAWLAVVVWNNHGYLEIEKSMREAGIEPIGVHATPPDFLHIARAYGYQHRAIADLDALDRALDELLARRQVMLIEVLADEAFQS